jgi:hypothetical protein
MRRLLVLGGGLLVTSAYFAVSALPALSADSAAVTAVVQVQSTEPCISLDTTTINFGPLPFSTPGAAPSGGFASPDVVAHSCSSGTERLFVSGTDASNASTSFSWALSPGPQTPCELGLNVYRLDADHGLAVVSLTTSAQEARIIDPDQSIQLRHSIQMPCVGSNGAGETAQMSIIYTTTF